METRLKENTFDLVVIGGGATGCGLALDAATRGLKTLLLEKEDFASGTSSKSSKLLHGGVRYLEQAIRHRDKGQYQLVKEALKERFLLLQNAPHLCHPLTFIVPLYRWKDLPYLFTGLCLYDFIAKDKSLGRTKLISAHTTCQIFPFLKEKKLKAGLIYYDGQFNDFRLAISLVKSASKYGATLLNYAEVQDFILHQGKIKGVVFVDKLTGKTLEVKAKVVINATGPWLDKIRKLANPGAEDLLIHSKGSHLVFKLPIKDPYALLIPRTKDNRVIFLLPWFNQHYLLGTTDIQSSLEDPLKPSKEEIDYLLQYFHLYFDYPLEVKHLTSSWAGLRPLLKNNSSKDTASLSREHYIEIMENNLVSIAGGKWTTFRKMAQETLDLALSKFNLTAKKCLTSQIKLFGSETFDQAFKQNFLAQKELAPDILNHLLNTYGDRAYKVLELAKNLNLTERILEGFPYILAEVVYCLEEEYVFNFLDFLARRIDLAEINVEKSILAIEKIQDIFCTKLNWDRKTLEENKKQAITQLKNFTF